MQFKFKFKRWEVLRYIAEQVNDPKSKSEIENLEFLLDDTFLV